MFDLAWGVFAEDVVCYCVAEDASWLRWVLMIQENFQLEKESQ